MDKGICSVFVTSVLGFINAHQQNVAPLNSVSSYTDGQLYEGTLKLHNDYRLRHGSEPLTLDTALCVNAMKWATELANENKFAHQTNSPYGENLYAMWSSRPVEVTAEDVFFAWYNEGHRYDYRREPRNNKAGHFTQIVWKGTRYLGVAVARSSGRTVIVAVYYPPGNCAGQADALIPNTVRNKFRTCIVLTIAHRLNTVMDSDVILVMDYGQMVEFDSPRNLLENKNGFLYKIVEQTGHASSDLLHSIVAESYETGP